jgi:beta-1,4-mannosyl-glycoprotein beta-1,4-N-acetylglucosaminyltransferase
MFLNELDFLEFRLNVLDKYVDYFVISEADITFSGIKREPIFLKNIHRFEKWKHKIIYKVCDNTPDQFTNLSILLTKDENRNKIIRSIDKYHHFPKEQTQWGREFYQRECVLCLLLDCKDNDIILLSDLDEVPNPKVLQELIKNGILDDNFYHLMCPIYQYYFNVKKPEHLETWYGTKICTYKYIKDKESNLLRIDKNAGIHINNGGWHFSFCGGADLVKDKIQASGHMELNRPDVINNIQRNIDNNQDIYFRYGNQIYDIIKIDDTFPEELTQNLEKYKKFIKNYGR